MPSETATLFALGLGDRLVGRTRYCVEPADRVTSIPVCGGIRDIDVDRVMSLAPDLVLANQEENPREPISTLVQNGVSVLVSMVSRVADAIGHISRLARLFEVTDRSEVGQLVRSGYQLLRARPVADPVTVFVPIWTDPLMTFGGDTYPHDLLAQAGAANVFGDSRRRYPAIAERSGLKPLPGDGIDDRGVRYPEVSLAEVAARRPELILVPSEPHDFTEAEIDALRGLDVPAARRDAIVRCDGRDLFWYGGHSVAGLTRLRELIAAHRRTE